MPGTTSSGRSSRTRPRSWPRARYQPHGEHRRRDDLLSLPGLHLRGRRLRDDQTTTHSACGANNVLDRNAVDPGHVNITTQNTTPKVKIESRLGASGPVGRQGSRPFNATSCGAVVGCSTSSIVWDDSAGSGNLSLIGVTAGAFGTMKRATSRSRAASTTPQDRQPHAPGLRRGHHHDQQHELASAGSMCLITANQITLNKGVSPPPPG